MNPHPKNGTPRWYRRIFALAAVILVPTGQAAEKWTITGWNNLGMHCMDADYSVFSILPPSNTLHAQVIHSVGTTSADMVTTLMTGADGIRVTYEAVADPAGSINTTSSGKTNFWTYAQALYGTALPVDMGLAGASMPGTANTRQPFSWDASNDCFTADGIPIVPKDDAGKKNFYPMMRLKVYDSAGNLLPAQADVVVPVSDEMDCRACHGSNSKLNDARPFGGWVNDPNAERDYRLNILKKHDDVLLGTSLYQQSLAAKSYREDGLFKTVTVDAKPILCAACHSSGALRDSGYTGVSPLTQALHSTHARVVDPDNGLALGSVKNRGSCYQCHPGSDTNCLRGAMGSAVAADGSMQMQCQSCHGSMMQVGAANRTGWLDEPNCQQCHTGTAVNNNGQIRYTSVYEASGQPRVAVNQTFATNPNSPEIGKSLYRTSSGHGGMKCQACHGSTHAEFPAGTNDNVQSIALQGHEGVLSECSTCHAQTPPTSTAAQYAGGPHGLHPMTKAWSESTHKSSSRRTGCTNCHGSDWKGTVLSEMQKERSMKRKDSSPEYLTYWRGYRIGCWSCHNGTGGSGAPPASPVVTSSPTSVTQASIPFILDFISSPTTATVRIVKQPAHGTVALNGNVAVYYPAKGYSGPDSFTFAARDASNSVDSNLGTVSVSAANYLLWRGDGTANNWDTTTPGNWLLQGTSATAYSNGTSVTLDDTGSTSPTINLSSALTPSALAVNSSKDYTIGGSGSLGGTMSLAKYGSGTLTLGNNHTFTGTTTIQGGTIKAGALAVTGGASSLGNATSTVTLGGPLGKGALAYTGNSATFTRGFTIGSGGGQLDATISGQTLTLGTGDIAAGGPLTFGGNGNIQVNSVVSGSGSFTQAGTGTTTLTAANTYSGATTVNNGRLVIRGQSYFNVWRTTTVASGAVFELNNSNNTFTSLMPVSTVTGAGTFRLLGSSTINQSENGVSGTRLTFAMQAGGWIDLLDSSKLTNGGWQEQDWTNNKASMNIASGATFDIWDGQSVTIDALTGSGTVDKVHGGNSPTSLTVGVADGGGTFSGTIKNTDGQIALTKVGGGTQVLAGPNTYTGNTTILGGILDLSGFINSGGTSTVRAANGGTLRLSNGNITAGSLVVDAGGTLAGYGSLQGNLVNNGTVAADGASPIIVNGSITNSGTVRLTDGNISSTGMFINNGLLDIINGPQTLPPNFQNNGTVLDSRSVRISASAIVDSSFVLSVASVPGHHYQMQRAESLSGPWEDLGPPQPGSGAVLQFTDPGGAAGAQKRFYRIQITP